MKNFLIVLFVLLFVSVSLPVYASDSITLPNGSSLNIKNLSDEEIQQAISLARKSIGEAPVAAKDVKDFILGINPEELDAIRKLVTGTIRDVCSDLSITVNEFVKTPVGMGTAGLIIYKVAGKDLLENMLDIIVMIPLWCIWSSISLFLLWRFMSQTIIYETVERKSLFQYVKSDPVRQKRYEWKSEEAKSVFVALLFIGEIIVTFSTVAIILST